MLRLIDLQKSYRLGQTSIAILHQINLSIESNEFIALMGPSGSGKSTLLNILGILDDYDQGEYWLDGTLMKSLTETRAAQYRNRFIGFVFQSFNLLSHLTALENVALPLRYLGQSLHERTNCSKSLLTQMGLEGRFHHLPTELSGGQRQRVAIARALATRPRLILADEPTGNLDSSASREILDVFSTLHRDGATIVLVTHDEEVARRTQRTVRIRDGRVV
ncbi:MAG: ABC transporter ATP-binding protein [Nitrospirales bacterium]|nr:ABC transporter ATP-binding protein [Nitrospirales bacterium]